MYIEEDSIRDLMRVRSQFTQREWEIVNKEIGKIQEEKAKREAFKTELNRQELKLLNGRLKIYM